MGFVKNGAPQDLVLLLRDQFKLDLFIETGTSHGDTAAWAASCFKQVITIEGSEKYFREASERHRRLKNIRFIHADSRNACSELVPLLTEPAVFWLDGHWCGEDTFGKNAQCPLLEEIRLINASPTTHFILIDDARLFLAPPCEPHPVDQWPNIEEVLAALRSGSHPYHIIIFDDVIIAVPLPAKETIVQYCRKLSTERLHETISAQNTASAPRNPAWRGLKQIYSGFKEKLKL